MKGFALGVAAIVAGAGACATGNVGYSTDDDGGAPDAADPDPPPDAGPTADGAKSPVVGDDSGANVPDANSVASRDSGPPGTADASDDAGSIDAAGDDAGLVAAVSGSCNPASWVVSASASAPNNSPAFAVDGLPPTRWSTGVGQAVGQYFQIDFGGPVFLDQIVLDDSYGTNEAEDYPRDVSVLGSSDGASFGTTITTADFSTDPGAVATIGFPLTTTRAVRLQLTTGVSSVWWAIHELRVDCHPVAPDGGEGSAPDAGDDAAAPSCAAASGAWAAGAGISHGAWTPTASSVGPNDTVQGAIDGTSSTRWSSGQAQAGGEWFKVDLGQATSISGVALYLLDSNTSDYPSSYALQLSNDDLTYSTVAAGLGAVTTAMCFPTQSARYVRVTQTGTGDASWWSIYEMNVFP
jgi:beta-glucosidase